VIRPSGRICSQLPGESLSISLTAHRLSGTQKYSREATSVPALMLSWGPIAATMLFNSEAKISAPSR
jgi:hypothetical protein